MRLRARQREIESAAAEQLRREGLPEVSNVRVLDELVRLVAEVVEIKDRIGGYVASREGVSTAEMAVFERALDRCGRLLVAVAALDLDARRVNLERQTAEQLAEEIDYTLKHIGVANADIGKFWQMFVARIGAQPGLPQ